MRVITVKTREPFLLEKDVCLESTSAVRLYLPPGLLVAGEQFGDVVNLSDDQIEVGFKESSHTPKKLSAVIVYLRPKDRIKLNRSAEVIADVEGNRDVTFNIVG
jgi:hypothetical protein